MPDEEKKDHGQILNTWKFPEYTVYKRTRGWYVIAILIGIGLMIWALVTANYLFAIFIIMVGIIIFFQTRYKPKSVIFQITEDGLTVGSSFYEWLQIEKFWIVYHPPEVKKMFFSLKGALRPALAVPLFEQNPLKIRQTLKKYLEEDVEREDEPTSDALNRLFKLG